MSASPILARISRHVQRGGRLWLLLDYDGTLVPIAPSPDEAQPDAALLELLTHLARTPAFRTAILSGRPLSGLEAMLPVPGLILAGLYGVEIQMRDRSVQRRIEPGELRSAIEQVKAAWMDLIGGRSGFLIEDKGCAVALHARFASETDAEAVLPRARLAASRLMPADRGRLLGGDRFLEVAPAAANKGEAVAWLLDHGGLTDALPIYFGDDDKDEEAFATVRQRGGIPIGVGSRKLAHALEYLPSPEVVRAWLQHLAMEAEPGEARE